MKISEKSLQQRSDNQDKIKIRNVEKKRFLADVDLKTWQIQMEKAAEK